MITLSLQTKLGEKVSILFDRLMDLWNGTDSSKKKGKSGNVKVTQPIAGQQQMGGSITGQVMMPQSQPTYTDGTSINSLPTSSITSTQQLPNYDNMYKEQNTPLVNAATPGAMEGFQEPMAANAVLGGGAFGSW
jgi:hypothetical protein